MTISYASCRSQKPDLPRFETHIVVIQSCGVDWGISTEVSTGVEPRQASNNKEIARDFTLKKESIIDFFKAFEHGASTVMIAACEKDRCHIGGTGNEIAQVQVDVARDILKAIGWKGERVDMFRMFSAEPERFTNAVNEMVKRAKKLGPTPVHEGTAGKWMEVPE